MTQALPPTVTAAAKNMLGVAKYQAGLEANEVQREDVDWTFIFTLMPGLTGH